MLKQLVYIFVLIFGLNFTSSAQSKTATTVDQSAKFIKFYPNPATTEINFEFQRGYDNSYSFIVYSFMGKKVFESKFLSQKVNLSLADFYRGVYFYHLRDKNGTVVESGKFQVVK